MKKILLVNNGSHVGVACIGEAYKKAFEHLGMEFTYLDFYRYPRMHNDAVNLLLLSQMFSVQYDVVIMIQPTYLYASTYSRLLSLKDHTKFYSIQTEDPYSVSGIIQMFPLFSGIFTNEKVCAEKFEINGFKYLPVAYDSFKTHKKSSLKKKYDYSMICSYYGKRIEHLEAMREYEGDKFIAGNVSYLAKHNMAVDLSCFSRSPGLMPRHKELQVYSESKYVINQHREPSIVGKTDFLVPQKDCVALFNEAVSPNPRFYETIACGSIPLVDSGRKECLRVLQRHWNDELPIDIYLPSNLSAEYLQERAKLWYQDEKYLGTIRGDFMDKESYLARAKTLLAEIDVKVEE